MASYDSHPQHVFIDDFNNDKYLDIVVANTGSNSIGVRLGFNDGNFTNETSISTGVRSQPRWVETGDFNNDGKVDIAVANYGTNSIGIFLGYGNGSFQEQILHSLDSSRPVSFTVADINNDDRLDIAVVSTSTFTVSILLGLGTASFQLENSYHMGYDSNPCSIAISNFNNDDQLDLVVTNYGTNELVVLVSINNGRMYSIDKYSTGSYSRPCSVAIANLNNDLYNDIAVANFGTGKIGIFLGNGDGTFTNMNIVLTQKTFYPLFIDAGYINNDDKLDLVVVNSIENEIKIFRGFGNGTFSLDTSYSTGYGSGTRAIALGDFDNDKKDDIVVINYGFNNIFLLTSYKREIRTFQISYNIWINDDPNTICVGDINNDQNLDVIFSDYTNKMIRYLSGSGNGTFTIEVSSLIGNSQTRPYLIIPADFNNDGKLDLAVSLFDGPAIIILTGFNSGQLYEEITYTFGSENPSFITTTDLDDDGNVDIVSTNPSNNTIIVLFGDGRARFKNKRIYSTGAGLYPIHIAVADMNNDGLIDILCANLQNSIISVHINEGRRNFRSATSISTFNYRVNFIAVTQLNDDTHQDIVVAFPSSDHIGVMLGSANGNFPSLTTYYTGSTNAEIRTILFYDFNDDNSTDILALNSAEATVIIFYGNTDGVFNTSKTFTIKDASEPQGMVIGDFNGDHEIDIAVNSRRSRNIDMLLFRNTSDFSKQYTYSQGSNPYPTALAAADLNKDGISDIIVANSGNNQIQIFDIGTDIPINATVLFTGTNSYPTDVVIIDLNKDDQLDIVVINLRSSSLIVFLGSADGKFEISNEIYRLEHDFFPIMIKFGDFNEDNWTDLIIVGTDKNYFNIFFGYNYPTFTSSASILMSYETYPYIIGKGDFNGDSILDIVVVSEKASSLYIYVGIGNGSFEYANELLIFEALQPIQFAVADFNDDNMSDIVVVNNQGANIIVFLLRENVTYDIFFPESKFYRYNMKILIGDFNNDKKYDFIVVYGNKNAIDLYIGHGNGSFTIRNPSYYLRNGSYPIAAVVSDLNKDENLDIVVANFFSDSIEILFGNGDGTFKSVATYSDVRMSSPNFVAVGDFNNDNQLDIVVLTIETNVLGIFLGHGNGTFSLPIVYTTINTSWRTSVIADDMNNDGILDIIITSIETPEGYIGILCGSKNGKFLSQKNYMSGIDSAPWSIVAGDFNNDGKMDYAFVDKKSNRLTAVLQDKFVTLGTAVPVTTNVSSTLSSIIVSDFNNDNHLDLAFTEVGTNSFNVFLGNGNEKFSPFSSYFIANNSHPQSIAVGHFNNDHYIDAVVLNSNINSISIFLGYGNGTFAYTAIYSTGVNSGPSSVVAHDLNNDNRTDIIVTNSGINNFLIFIGFGNGTFEIPKIFSLDYGSSPISLTIDDFNNDTWIDIAITNSGFGYVDFFLQTC